MSLWTICTYIQQPILSSKNQSIDRPTDHSTTNQLIHWSINRSIDRTSDQPTNWSIDRSINQPINKTNKRKNTGTNKHTQKKSKDKQRAKATVNNTFLPVVILRLHLSLWRNKRHLWSDLGHFCSSNYLTSNDRMIMNWKGSVCHSFRYYPDFCLEELRNTTENVSPNNWCSGEILNEHLLHTRHERYLLSPLDQWRRTIWYICTNVSKKSSVYIFYPEEGEISFLWNVSAYLPNYTA
jgi:hypothetical protein